METGDVGYPFYRTFEPPGVGESSPVFVGGAREGENAEAISLAASQV